MNPITVVNVPTWTPISVDLSYFVGLQIAVNISVKGAPPLLPSNWNYLGIDSLCVVGIYVPFIFSSKGLNQETPSCSRYFYSPGAVEAVDYRSPSFSWSTAGMTQLHNL